MHIKVNHPHSLTHSERIEIEIEWIVSHLVLDLRFGDAVGGLSELSLYLDELRALAVQSQMRSVSLGVCSYAASIWPTSSCCLR